MRAMERRSPPHPSARVLFRCDASSALGLGHLSRSLVLAAALAQRGARCLFACRRLAPDLTSLPRDRGHELEILPGPTGDDLRLPESDLEATVRAAAALRADWAVVDSYGASSEYLEALSRSVRVCALDDLADRDLSTASLVVNPTPGAGGWPYRCRPEALLAGPTYALLAPVFARTRAAPREPREATSPHRVLVTLGGGDDGRATEIAAQQVLAAIPGAKVRAVLGPASQPAAQERVRRLAVETLGPATPEGMALRMSWADLAVATPSTTAWELSCVGVPSVLWVAADNQRRIAEFLRAQRLCAVVERPEDVAGAIRSGPFDAAGGARWRALCDGEGARRVAERMLLSAGSSEGA
jgi:UDP-2,4-diacetamido-2,4,6-trideoxy-beta-L-altropyranose hydrolase